MRMEQILVTPELAMKWLDKNESNRPIKQSVIERYSHDLRAGRWGLTHQGIAFKKSGALGDGQHRLWAIVETGIPVLMNVFWDVPDDSFEFVDAGIVRTARDIYHFKHPGAETRVLEWGISRRMLFGTRWRASTSRAELVAFYEQYRDIITFVVREVMHGRVVRRITSASVMAPMCRALIAGEDPERIREFGEALINGTTTSPEDSAVVILRNWLLLGYRRQIGISADLETYLKTQKALRLFLQRREVSHIRIVKDEQDEWPLPEPNPHD